MVPDLIYDVGMHDGSDTAYYLHKGFRVVAVEANPLLVESAAQRFAAAIDAGRLVIVNRCIAAGSGAAQFWINDDRSEWSAFDKAIGCREGTSCHPIEVQCVRFRDLLAEHGVPYYLKLDIECNDRFCLDDLSPDDVPRYVSVEAHQFDYLCTLHHLGYRHFKCVNQRNHNDPGVQRINNESLLAGVAYVLEKNPRFRKLWSATANAQWRSDPSWSFPAGSSGPFGEETYGPWETLEQVAYNWLHHKLGNGRRGTLNRRGWHDFHAKR